MERELISRIQLTTTQAGKPVVHLFSTDTRLQFPVLTLFDLSALESVGIDPNALAPDDELHHRFYAYWTPSDKTNSAGNPYRDVHYLEPLTQPATATSVDPSAALTELREIRRLLVALSKHLAPELPIDTETGELTPGPSLMAYANGDHVADNPKEQQAFIAYLAAEKNCPPDRDALRAWFLAID